MRSPDKEFRYLRTIYLVNLFFINPRFEILRGLRFLVRSDSIILETFSRSNVLVSEDSFLRQDSHPAEKSLSCELSAIDFADYPYPANNLFIYF